MTFQKRNSASRRYSSDGKDISVRRVLLPLHRRRDRRRRPSPSSGRGVHQRRNRRVNARLACARFISKLNVRFKGGSITRVNKLGDAHIHSDAIQQVHWMHTRGPSLAKAGAMHRLTRSSNPFRNALGTWTSLWDSDNYPLEPACLEVELF